MISRVLGLETAEYSRLLTCPTHPRLPPPQRRNRHPPLRRPPLQHPCGPIPIPRPPLRPVRKPAPPLRHPAPEIPLQARRDAAAFPYDADEYAGFRVEFAGRVAAEADAVGLRGDDDEGDEVVAAAWGAGWGAVGGDVEEDGEVREAFVLVMRRPERSGLGLE